MEEVEENLNTYSQIHLEGTPEVLKILREHISFDTRKEYFDNLYEVCDLINGRQNRKMILKSRSNANYSDRVLTIKEEQRFPKLLRIKGERNIDKALQNLGIPYFMITDHCTISVGCYLLGREVSLDSSKYGIIYVDYFENRDSIKHLNRIYVEEGSNFVVKAKFENREQKDNFLNLFKENPQLIKPTVSKIEKCYDHYLRNWALEYPVIKMNKEEREEDIRNMLEEWERGPYKEEFISKQELRDIFPHEGTEKERRKWSKQFAKLCKGHYNYDVKNRELHRKLITLNLCGAEY